jgi:hypothetical protein
VGGIALAARRGHPAGVSVSGVLDPTLSSCPIRRLFPIRVASDRGEAFLSPEERARPPISAG